MKMLFHLVYALCLAVPVLINFAICFFSYQWHTRFRLAMARELEELRRAQGKTQ